MIREVWKENFDDEMCRIHVLMFSHHVMVIDTEFPGFLRNTPRDAYEEQRYEDLKFNVDRMELIQLGFALCDERGEIGAVWQFNFSNFNPVTDVHVPASIQLLRKNGIDLEKNLQEGVDVCVFAEHLKRIMSVHHRLQWITFHGLYDLAYLLKMLSGKKELPDSLPQFAKTAGDVFGSVYDVKFMARYCDGLMGGELGLERLAKILDVERVGEAHQAGSDYLDVA
ncbi:hypothetical protein F0562_020186 [Nyssa sinensis]|uniref:poly(A)-specific ribonuclease n=1 Tax=Nyssa sinensis TaxID=561372 RepID=A0A5J5BV00_9ASTE|nr:hypothetical protein F0562_020186 [Nyssa sinensis]